MNRLGGFVLLGVAAVVAVAVGAYFFLGEDEAPAAEAIDCSQDLAKCSGVTPAAGTGVLQPERPEIGQPAPDFALIDARDGVTVRKLSDYRGKAVLLNWYASWCDPCKREIPVLQAVVDRYPNDVIVLGVDPLESKSKAAGILEEFDATYPAVLDSSGAVTDHYRIGVGLPKTYFIDKDGILRATKTGEIHQENLRELLASVGITN